MLYFHVDPTMGHRSGFQVTYTTIKSISEWFTIMWILDWVKNLNLKSHIEQLQAFRNVLPSCASFYGSWIWIQSYIYNNVFLVLVSHWPHTSHGHSHINKLLKFIKFKTKHNLRLSTEDEENTNARSEVSNPSIEKEKKKCSTCGKQLVPSSVSRHG